MNKIRYIVQLVFPCGLPLIAFVSRNAFFGKNEVCIYYDVIELCEVAWIESTGAENGSRVCCHLCPETE